jgi:hypothetical protein
MGKCTKKRGKSKESKKVLETALLGINYDFGCFLNATVLLFFGEGRVEVINSKGF